MSYGCEKCLKQTFVLSSTLHNHKKVCIKFITKKSAADSASKPSSGGGGNGSHGNSTRSTPKRRNPKASATYSQGSSTQPTSQSSLHYSGQEMSCHHKSHKDSKDSSGEKKTKKKKDTSPTRWGSSQKVCQDGGHHEAGVHLSTTISFVFLSFLNKLFYCKTCVSVLI